MFHLFTAAKGQIGQWFEQRTIDRMATQQYDQYLDRLEAEAFDATMAKIAADRLDEYIAARRESAALWATMSSDAQGRELAEYDALAAQYRLGDVPFFDQWQALRCR